MAIKQVKDGEVWINDRHYTLNGRLTSKYISRFPAKMGIGPDDYSFEQFLSNWIIKDQRGGIGREEMDESVDFDRCWWTNCVCDYEGHMFLPRLATALTNNTDPTSLSAIANADMELDSDWTGGTRSSTEARSGTYSRRTYNENATQALTGFVPGAEYTFTCYCKVAAANLGRVGIGDGVDITYGSYVATGSFLLATVTKTLSPQATELTLYLSGQNVAYAYFDDAAITGPTTLVFGTAGKFCNFNGDCYKAFGRILAKVNRTTGKMEPVCDFGSGEAITDLITSLNSRMYVLMGDTDNYYWMSTSDVLTETASDLAGLTADATTDTDTIVDAGLNGLSIAKCDYAYNTTRSAGAYVDTWDDGTDTVELLSTIASQASGDTYSIFRAGTWGIHWDSKLFRFNANGHGSYSTNPDNATPTWTSLTASLADIKDEIESFGIGKDADGNDVIYCATNSWLMTLDFTNDKWIRTAVKLPSHPNGGKGFCYWHDGHYISYGLGVKRYITGSTATISEVGLIKDDGLPVEYNGEITKLSGDSGLDVLFALIDASQTSGNSKSGLYAYTGRAWRCWWADTNNNSTLNDVIVSSAESGYAVYWDDAGLIRYIDIHRGIANAQQLAGVQEYETSGIWLSPWFDADTAAFKKLLKRLRTYTSGVNTNETIAIKYRMDKANTDLDTGWTTLETLNTTGESGENEEVLASGAGVNFHTYQIRLDLARGGTNTNSPDMQSLVSAYRKLTTGNWQHIIPIIIDGRHGRTKKQQQSDLETAATSETDVKLLYREDATNETKYVIISLPQSWSQTGQHWQGEYVITALET